jgi:thioredoxin reductase (NADPH)
MAVAKPAVSQIEEALPVSPVSHPIERVDAIFDEPSLVADAGLIVPATLMQRLDLEALVDDVVRLVGGRFLRRVEVENTRTGEREWLDARVVFVFIGAEPHTRWLGDEVAVDERGFVLAGPEAVAAVPHRDGSRRRTFLFETSVAGVFAVRDVRGGSVKRVASAVGEGSMVVRLVHEYLDEVVGPDDVRSAPVTRPSRSLASASS